MKTYRRRVESQEITGYTPGRRSRPKWQLALECGHSHHHHGDRVPQTVECQTCRFRAEKESK